MTLAAALVLIYLLLAGAAATFIGRAADARDRQVPVPAVHLFAGDVESADR